MKKRMMTMNKLHGSPYDRGSADAYYRRPINPPYYPSSDVGFSEPMKSMTKDQENEYLKGYWDQQKSGDFKDYD
jgi:hypothetical protein